MGSVVPPEAIPLLLAGGGMFVVALAVLAIDFSARVNRAFATFLVLRGGVNVLTAFRLAEGGAADALAFDLLPYFALAVAPATAWFFLVYRRSLTARSRAWTLAGILAATLAVEIAYWLGHDLYLASGPAGSYGPLYMLVGASHFGYALVAAALAREHARALTGGARAALLLSAVGFALNPLFLALNHLVTHDVAQLWPEGSGVWFRANHVIEIAAAIPVAFAAREFARAARDGPDDAARRHARLALRSLLLPAVSAGLLLLLLVAPWSVPSRLQQATYNGFDGLWALSLPLLVGYGLAKRQLFDIDVKLRWTVSRGTLVAGFAVAFIATSRLADIVLAPRLGAFVGVAVFVLLALAIIPLVTLGERVAGALLPGVAEAERLTERKLDVYRAALESALTEDGTILPRQERILASLRARLGVTDRDHAVLVYAVRGLAPTAGEKAGDLALGRYRLIEFLGEGGQGRTWLAEDERLARRVVVKLLRSDLADEGALREARALAALRHPNVVTLYDVDRSGTTPVIVMEHVPGGSLAARLRTGPVRGAEFTKIAHGLLDALDAFHQAGGVHRDVKPSNVLLGATGEAKLADFGIARLPGMETTVGAFDGDARGGGTIRFMSPEQARGRRVTARSDVFSAAATLWETWTGDAYLAPEDGESQAELRMRAASARAFDRALDGPPELGAWFARALDPSPEGRFASAREAREALPGATPVVQ